MKEDKIKRIEKLMEALEKISPFSFRYTRCSEYVLSEIIRELLI